MIDKTILKSMATEKSYKRGVNYYNMDMVNEPKVADNTIFAEVSGNSFPYYEVEINIDNPDINFCSCPYDFGGVCKHIIALGLKWYYNKEAFQEIEEIDENFDIYNDDYLIFEGLKEDDLIRIFNDLFQKNEMLKLDVIKYRERTNNINLKIIHEKLRVLKEKTLAILGEFNRYGGGSHTDEYDFFDYVNGMIDILVNYTISKSLRKEILKDYLDQYLKSNSSLEDHTMSLIKAAAKTDDEWSYIIKRLEEFKDSRYHQKIIENIKLYHLQGE